jgi:Lrp/AsnC family transcriptional regulator for asnA, asnC and gidA
MYRLDALDRQIILHLQRDGRIPYVELARLVGVSEATVRRRVERLIAEGVIEVVACVEPRKVGLGVEALVYLQAELDKLTHIGQTLAAMPEVREVIYTSGAHDLVLRVALASNDDLLPFLTRRVATIPGVKATQTSYVLQTEKHIHDWQLPERPVAPQPSQARPLILVVDDDADFCAAASMVLEAEGYQVMASCNGREAKAILQEQTPALILLDLMMETPLAGLEVLQAVRDDPRLCGIPVLAISAIRSSEWASAFPSPEQLPFDGFVDKPIEPGLLLEKVHRLVG